MNFEEKEKLRKNRVDLLKTIILPGELLDHLYQSGVISEVDMERIKAESISYNRVHQLLRILHTKPGCLGTFCESLDKSGYDFLATAIRETEVDPLKIEKGIILLYTAIKAICNFSKVLYISLSVYLRANYLFLISQRSY